LGQAGNFFYPDIRKLSPPPHMRAEGRLPATDQPQ
jgi:hypothetical protein